MTDLLDQVTVDYRVFFPGELLLGLDSAVAPGDQLGSPSIPGIDLESYGPELTGTFDCIARVGWWRLFAQGDRLMSLEYSRFPFTTAMLKAEQIKLAQFVGAGLAAELTRHLCGLVEQFQPGDLGHESWLRFKDQSQYVDYILHLCQGWKRQVPPATVLGDPLSRWTAQAPAQEAWYSGNTDVARVPREALEFRGLRACNMLALQDRIDDLTPAA